MFPRCYVGGTLWERRYARCVTLPGVTTPDQYGGYPGGRFGLPPDGHGSLASWGRRVLALAIDWVLSTLVVVAIYGPGGVYGSTTATQLARLIVFAIEAFILTSLLGGSAGQLILGVNVRRTSGARLDPPRALLRTLLICLVIPPVIYNRDRQGLHDLAVDSMTVWR
jgi:uncharacterized RDD family membrane protein YckC